MLEYYARSLDYVYISILTLHLDGSPKWYNSCPGTVPLQTRFNTDFVKPEKHYRLVLSLGLRNNIIPSYTTVTAQDFRQEPSCLRIHVSPTLVTVYVVHD